MAQTLNERHGAKASWKQASYAPHKASARQEQGVLMVHTGPGEGKTTVARGLAFQAPGQGSQVEIEPCGTDAAVPASETALVRKLAWPIEMYPLGDSFTWNTYRAGIKAQRGVEF